MKYSFCRWVVDSLIRLMTPCPSCQWTCIYKNAGNNKKYCLCGPIKSPPPPPPTPSPPLLLLIYSENDVQYLHNRLFTTTTCYLGVIPNFSVGCGTSTRSLFIFLVRHTPDFCGNLWVVLYLPYVQLCYVWLIRLNYAKEFLKTFYPCDKSIGSCAL